MEFFDVVNKQGIPTGKTVTRKQAHEEGICHRTAQVWLVRTYEGRPQVLLQKRLSTKESYPNCYDISAAGHIHAGDEPLESALRELEEELGICAEAKELDYMGNHYIYREEVFNGRLFKDSEVGFVYIYDRPVDIESLVLQPDEVDSVRWFDLDVILEKVAKHSSDCCVAPGGIQLVRMWFENRKG